MKIRERFALHSFLLAVYPLIFVYANNVHEINWLEVVCLSLTLLIITFISTFLLSFIFKKKGPAGIIVSFGLILFFSYGYLYDFLEKTFVIELRHRYPAGIYLGLFVLVTYLVVKTKHQLQNVTKIMNAVIITLVMISLTTIGYNAFQRERSSNLSKYNAKNDPKNQVMDVKNKPNVYYIILDEYAGEEALSGYFGYDNQDFISFLKDEGFYVVKNAKTNYYTTCLSLASSLNMEHLECIEGFKACITPSYCYGQISNNKVMKIFSEMGYKTVTFYGQPVVYFDCASDYLCGKYSNIMHSELLITVLGKSVLKPFYVSMFGQGKRNETLCILSELEKIEQSVDEPFFVFAHVMLPHHPFIFGSNGEPRTPKKIEMGDEALGGLEILDVDKEGYLENLKFTNKKMKEVISAILSRSKNPPIIIIQGDHGLKSTFDPSNPADKAVRERISILNAYYLPGEKRSLYATITPVNAFRLILNEYFDQSMELLKDSSYWMVPNREGYELKDVTSIVKNGPFKISNSHK